MTFEKILEVFDDFIASQATMELIKSKHGYVFLEWTLDYDYAAEAVVCTTPERMLEFLSSRYETYLILRHTEGLRDELTPAEEEAVRQELKKMLDRVHEA